eukprot:CAMPEP_0177700984 /NCGR_PEP_ID=MMETSP0484_2-20121128/6378_1 /TAXON_ID=354590 /ORGANISM="Rhodomonas lens, Strain RHODO" /LENGTH=232 /DNA_ID=CAMNT_0019212205 /DNA_START=146 /DNA_END=841 /DNA_ORIENTATION=+
MSTMSTSQSGTREVGGAKSGKDKNFAARRVPDFARLHAMEDARVARWKRQHSRKLTVPLAFKLTPAVPQPPALEKAGSENADSRSQNGSRTPRNERDAATSSKAPLAVKSGGQKENENKTQHTNGSALAGSGAGDRTSTRVGTRPAPAGAPPPPSSRSPSTSRRALSPWASRRPRALSRPRATPTANARARSDPEAAAAGTLARPDGAIPALGDARGPAPAPERGASGLVEG